MGSSAGGSVKICPAKLLAPPSRSGSLAAPGLVERVALEYGLFPLTLTLSLGEREPLQPRLGSADAHRFADRLPRILPLPKGEGWGEGKEDTRTVQASGLGLTPTHRPRRSLALSDSPAQVPSLANSSAPTGTASSPSAVRAILGPGANASIMNGRRALSTDARNGSPTPARPPPRMMISG